MRVEPRNELIGAAADNRDMAQSLLHTATHEEALGPTEQLALVAAAQTHALLSIDSMLRIIAAHITNIAVTYQRMSQ